MAPNLQARVVLARCRKYRAAMEASADHGTGPHAAYYDRLAAFWSDAAMAAAQGDLKPVRFPEDPPAIPQGDPVRVILVVIQ